MEYIQRTTLNGNAYTRVFYKPRNCNNWVSMRLISLPKYLNDCVVSDIEHNVKLPEVDIKEMELDDYFPSVLRHLNFIDTLY